MKQCYFFCFSLFFSLFSYSQEITFQPYHGITTYRMYKEVNPMGTFFEAVVWQEDTLINGQTYIKVYEGGFRQDTISGQTFYIDQNDMEHDITLPDLEVNESVVVSPELFMAFRITQWNMLDYMHQEEDTFKLKLNDLDSTLLVDGTYVGNYFYSITQNDQLYCDLYYNSIEGVTMFTMFERYGELLCYKENGVLVDDEPLTPPFSPEFYQYCLASIEEERITALTISPNPAQGSFRISADLDDSVSYILFDLAGKMVAEQKNYILDSEISTSNLDAGTYLIYVKSGDKSATGKVVVE